jgi:hypothetical protein
MSSSWEQLRALASLRWRMVRSRRQRVGFVLLAIVVGLFLAAAVGGSRLLPQRTAFDALVLTPTAFILYGALSVVGPLTAGGGNEMFPAEQLMPHPVRPATMFTASLLLAPLNIAWVGQTTALLALTTYVVPSAGGLPSAFAVTLAYVAAATTVGQAVAWAVASARQDRVGRLVVWALLAVVIVAAIFVVRAGITQTLDRAPTRSVLLAMLAGSRGHYTRWSVMVVALLLVTGAGLWAGIWSTRFALRRPPGLTAERVARAVPRRSTPDTVWQQLRRIDRAAVWRAPALRRGVLVMGGLPGIVTAVAGVDWETLGLAAGLVTAGAGLLFGVNVFCLDGPGALWLGSVPLLPATHLLAKTVAIAEVCVVAGSIALGAGAVRAEGHATTAAVVAAACAVIACTAAVTAACLRMSLTGPFRADLRDPRDTPAPPGAMAARSAQLAVQTTVLALVVSSLGRTGHPLAPMLFTLIVLALAGRSVLRSRQMYADPARRAYVLVTVASG